MKKVYLIPVILLLIPFGVYAEQVGSDCYDYRVSSGAGQVCERVDKVLSDLQIIKQQNAQIILQQSQTNHLLTIQNCYILYKNEMQAVGGFAYSSEQDPDLLIAKCGDYK